MEDIHIHTEITMAIQQCIKRHNRDLVPFSSGQQKKKQKRFEGLLCAEEDKLK